MQKILAVLVAVLVLGALAGSFLLWKAWGWRQSARSLKAAYQDHGGVGVYAEENAALLRAGKRPDAILVGASHTLAWGDLSSRLPGLEIVNRGIPGQLVPQYLLRFRQDVLDLSPRAVVIEGCAINATYEVPLRAVADSYASMAELARLHGIEPILTTTLPVGGSLERRLPGTNERVRRINDAILDLARREGFLVADYHAAVAQPDGTLPEEGTEDGLHCGSEIYDRMAAALGPVLERAAARPGPPSSGGDGS